MTKETKFTRVDAIENRGADGFYAVLDVAPPFQRLINGRRETTRAFNDKALKGLIAKGGNDASLQKYALEHLQRAEAAARMCP